MFDKICLNHEMLIEQLESAALLRGASGVVQFLRDHRQLHQELFQELQSPTLISDATGDGANAVCVGLRIESLPVHIQRELWSAFVQWQTLLPAEALQTLATKFTSMASSSSRLHAPPDASCVHLATHLIHQPRNDCSDDTEAEEMGQDSEYIDPESLPLALQVHLPTMNAPVPATTLSNSKKRQRSDETESEPAAVSSPPPPSPVAAPASSLPAELETRVAAIAKQLTILASPDTPADATAPVAELAAAAVDVLRRVMNQVLATQQTNEELFCLACTSLRLVATSDDALYQTTRLLVDTNWSSRYAGLFLDAVLLPRVLAATSVISRVTLQTVLLFHKPSYSVLLRDRLLVPLLASPSLGAAQGEAATRILRENCVPVDQLDLLLRAALEHGSGLILANEVVVAVLQNVLNMKPTLAASTVELLVHGVAAALEQAPALAKSAKLTTLVFTVVSKHSALCRPHVDELLSISSQLSSVMAKATLRAVQKLR